MNSKPDPAPRAATSAASRGRPLPIFVLTGADEARWRLCEQLAIEIMDAPVESETVWYAARSLFWSEIPTK